MSTIEATTDVDSSTPLWVWISLIAGACASFWSQAAVTEERLVPALNVIATHYHIPSDIAGATLMAAGASSPELLSSFISLFITHSSLGLGTIVGSEIFNQLIICAGAVYASKTGTLVLDKAIVTREVGFYALSILLLFNALKDSEEDPDDPTGPKHVYVSFLDAILLFGGYLLYIAVCANMDRVVGWFIGGSSGSVVDSQSSTLKTVDGKGYGAVMTDDESTSFAGLVGVHNMSIRDVPTMPFMHNILTEPIENLDVIGSKVTMASSQSAAQNLGVSMRPNKPGFISRTIRDSIHNGGYQDFMQHSSRPTNLHSMYDLEVDDYRQEVNCFLWQQSVFYTMAYFGCNAWHLRWFTIKLDSISSIPDRQNSEAGRITYPNFKEILVDEKRLIITIPSSQKEKRDFVLMAPTKDIFNKVVTALSKYIARVPISLTTLIEETNTNLESTKEHEELIDFPSDGSNMEIVFWVLLFPLRFLMHYTIPDVRKLDSQGQLTIPKTKIILNAFASTLMCLVWLIVGSYAMVASLEELAKMMNIPDAVIGFTVSAAGTSLPNYVASKVAAENGFGNQAVSNAFGSNTFNLNVGLGLPWCLYIAANGFQPYHGLTNEGIVESILIMAFVLAAFVILMIRTGFVLLKWHGLLFVGLYVAYIAYAIGQVYVK